MNGEWMLLAAVLKDGVTAFEVYLEKAVSEVRMHYGIPEPEAIWHWLQVKGFYQRHFSLTVETEVVRDIRRLGHILTHRRGELRTNRKESNTAMTNGLNV